MAPDEQALERFAATWAWPLRAIGFLIWMSTFVYAVVIALIHVFAFLPAETQSDEEALFVRVLALLLFVIGIASAPLTWKIRSLLLHSPRWASLLDRGDPSEPPLIRWHFRRVGIECNAPELTACRRQALNYFQASLIALAIAEAPGTFALVLALIQMFGGPGLGGDPVVLVAILVLAMDSLALKWTILPSHHELLTQLRKTTSGEEL